MFCLYSLCGGPTLGLLQILNNEVVEKLQNVYLAFVGMGKHVRLLGKHI